MKIVPGNNGPRLDFIEWSTKYVNLRNPLNGKVEPVILTDWQKAILDEAMRVDDEGVTLYETICWSCPKKSGKTAINALLMAYWAFEIEYPNEIVTVANKRDQAVSRGYREMKEFIKFNPILHEEVVAIPNDFAGEAGSNHGLTTWDELWGFTTERDMRLWDELTPVPTRKNSIRFEDLYFKIFDAQDNVKPGVEMPLGPNVPVYTIPEQRLFVYWDNKPRMPWQTDKYYAGQKSALRENTYLRLHENRWVSSETGLFDMDKWDACIDHDYAAPFADKTIGLYVGVDIGTKRDRSAVRTVYKAEDGKLYLGPGRFWQPTKENPIDLEETVEKFIIGLSKRYRILSVRYDPYQFHRSATTLVKKGINMIEYAQTTSNLQVMGQTLYDLVEYGMIKFYDDPDLRFEASCARAKEAMRGLQITKEKSSQKIDQVVALAMACVEIGQGFFSDCDLSGVPTG
jgi:phage terminase large subunit-like protein